jgi:hypothetical protein
LRLDAMAFVRSFWIRRACVRSPQFEVRSEAFGRPRDQARVAILALHVREVVLAPVLEDQRSARFATGVSTFSMQQNDESGSPVTWGEHVADEEYAAAPAT